MNKAKLQDAGIEEEKDEDNPLDPRQCGRCGETWSIGQDYCGNCSMALEKDSAERSRVIKEASEKLLKELGEDKSLEDLAEIAD